MPNLRQIVPLTVFLFFLIYSCTEIYNPKLDANAGMLVVDGKITNVSPPKVNLYRSTEINSTDTLLFESGALVTVHCSDGNSVILDEVSPGNYRPQGNDFIGENGKSYWVEITTMDEMVYESEPNEITTGIQINSIDGEQEKIVLSLDESIDAVSFYFDLIDNTNQSDYILWDYQDSWEWRTVDKIPKSDNPAYICYPTGNSTNVNIFNATNLAIKDIKHLKLSTITENDIKLLYEYYIKVNAYSVSKECYEFWKTIQSINESNGSIFDINPTNVKGNIKCCNNESEALGFFQSSSETNYSMGFTPDEYNIDFRLIASECEEYTSWTVDPSFQHYLRTDLINDVPFLIVRNNFCYDCSLKYPTNKPSFWP